MAGRLYKLLVNLTLGDNDSPLFYSHRQLVLPILSFVYYYKHSITASPRKYYIFPAMLSVFLHFHITF